MQPAHRIITDDKLTYQQKLLQLASAAEETLSVLQLDKEVQQLLDEGVICDMFEGAAPYRPRYVVPDYEKFLQQGSDFLQLRPSENLDDTLANLLVLYHHVPSITSFPVYIGNLDKLLQPRLSGSRHDLAAIKRFLTHIDRTMTDSFLHANIGPQDTPAGRLILQAENELENAIPNLTMKVSSSTPDEFIRLGVSGALHGAKPSFANHEMFSNDFPGEYAIVSCYNGLPVGGGSHSLARLNLEAIAARSGTEQDFFDNQLPRAARAICRFLDERIRFLVEESRFYETSFLVKEGLLDPERITAMVGVFALAEAVNTLTGATRQKDRFGHCETADNLGVRIIEALAAEIDSHRNKYCPPFDGRFLLHAQVGLDTDRDTSPGCRIPIGEEPPLPEHLTRSAPFHKYFPSGIGDIFPFEATAKNNPQAAVDIIRGAFAGGLRYFSLYSDESDVIRITGYLVKRSEIEKLRRGEAVLHDTVALGLGNVEHSRIYDRKIRPGQ